MPRKQIAVLDQTTAKGTRYSCGFHAVKNTLLTLLLTQNKIEQSEFNALSKSKAFFEHLYDQISPEPENPRRDLSRAEVKQALKDILAGNHDLTAFGLSNDTLNSLDGSAYTAFNIPFGDGQFGNDHIDSALAFYQLAQTDTPGNHIFALGGSFPPTYDGHWVTVNVTTHEDLTRSYTFMDSYQNQTCYFQPMIDGIETILSKDEEALDDYLLSVYDDDNRQFSDIYHRFFEEGGKRIPNDGQQVPDPRHEGHLMPRGCFDDAPGLGDHEWIGALQYAMRHGDHWATSVQSKFNVLASADLLDNPATKTYLKQLYHSAEFLSQTPGLDLALAESMSDICRQIKTHAPDICKVIEPKVEQPRVNPINTQILNLSKQIEKLEKSIEVSLRLIDGEQSKSIDTRNTRLLSKAQSGLIKKLERLDSLCQRKQLAEEHQAKLDKMPIEVDGIGDTIAKQQQFKNLLQQTKTSTSPDPTASTEIENNPDNPTL